MRLLVHPHQGARLERAASVIWVSLMSLVACLLCGCLVRMPSSDLPTAAPPSPETTSSETAKVPDVTDRSPNAATRIIEQRGLKVGGRTQEPSADVAAGRVVRTVPSAGEKVPVPSEVYLIVSEVPGDADGNTPRDDGGGGADSIPSQPSVESSTRRVPNVTGSDKNSAVDKLEQRGFQVRVRVIESNAPVNRVVGQVPSPGERLAVGQTVSILVAAPLTSASPSPMPAERPTTALPWPSGSPS